MPARPVSIHVDEIGDVTVVRFLGCTVLDDEKMTVVSDELLGLLRESERRNFLVNFKNVTYLSSRALRVLIILNEKVNKVGGQLVLSNLIPQVHEIFKITKLDEVFTIRPDIP